MTVSSVKVPSNPQLKMVMSKKEVKPVSIIPSSDRLSDKITKSEDLRDVNTYIGYLQMSNKTLKNINSLLSDAKVNATKMNYDTATDADERKEDARKILNSIKELMGNAKIGQQNVFSVDYSKYALSFDPSKIKLDQLNIMDINSIDNFMKLLKKSQEDIVTSLASMSSKIDIAKDDLLPKGVLDRLLSDKNSREEFKNSHKSVSSSRVHELLA